MRTKGKEARTHLRAYRRVQVSFKKVGEDERRVGFSTNISATGMYVSTSRPFGTGTKIVAELQISGAAVSVRATVVRSVVTPPAFRAIRPSGMGVQFLEERPELAATLRADEPVVEVLSPSGRASTADSESVDSPVLLEAEPDQVVPAQEVPLEPSSSDTRDLADFRPAVSVPDPHSTIPGLTQEVKSGRSRVVAADAEELAPAPEAESAAEALADSGEAPSGQKAALAEEALEDLSGRLKGAEAALREQTLRAGKLDQQRLRLAKSLATAQSDIDQTRTLSYREKKQLVDELREMRGAFGRLREERGALKDQVERLGDEARGVGQEASELRLQGRRLEGELEEALGALEEGRTSGEFRAIPSPWATRTRVAHVVAGVALGLLLAVLIAVLIRLPFSRDASPSTGAQMASADAVPTQLDASGAQGGEADAAVGARPSATPEVEPADTTQPGQGVAAGQGETEDPVSVDQANQAAKAETPEPAAEVEPPSVEQALQAWATAWSEQRVGDYLAAYADAFSPPNGLGRSAWEAQRRDRLLRPSSIAVTLGDIAQEELSDGRIRATFRQSYETPTYSDQVTKTLTMVLEDGAWRIAEELSSP